jgi:acetate kinase
VAEIPIRTHKQEIMSPASAASLLVINTGSSTLKYKLFPIVKTLGGVGAPIFSGLAELSMNKNTPGRIVHQCLSSKEKKEVKADLPTHQQALEQVVDQFFGGDLENVKAIGHRVVHGGEAFHDATLINDKVIDALKANIVLAPLHNPANLLGIDVATKVFGTQIPQVGVFDTAFHAKMPPRAFLYAIPYDLYKDHGVRRYGFHGTSHQYVAEKAAKMIGKPFEKSSFITFHLGNGSSMAAIRDGQCVDTSMGMTPLEGLVMGTRSGNVDPALHSFLSANLKMSLPDIDKLLNKKSGLLGLCGDSDIRRIQDRVRANDKQADLALDVFAHRARKYLGSYLLELEGSLDALVFTAGIGENSFMVRERICRDLGFLGIEVDPIKNAKSMLGVGPVEIQTTNSKIKVMVIPTDEERSIAERTYEIVFDKLKLE